MDARNVILNGDALCVLRRLPSNSVHACVTSPPYWGLRDYGTRRWFGGDPACAHDHEIENGARRPGQVPQSKWAKLGAPQTAVTYSCSKCSAWYGQLGLEPTPDLFVEHLVEIFREVKRVLRPDGTCWLNLGDSYFGDTPPRRSSAEGFSEVWEQKNSAGRGGSRRSGAAIGSLKPKDLVGVPWMVAFALRADGWHLRSDIIWAKGSTLPESVLDRPTKSHEHVFLLTKSRNYFYDSQAIAEKSVTGGQRNKRDVWHLNSKPFKGAHFAVFPPGLPETCIEAGTSERGCCGSCGAPIERVLKRATVPKGSSGTKYHAGSAAGQTARSRQAWRAIGLEGPPPPTTVGWTPTCKCSVTKAVPCVVLDPFAGSGTTLMTARQLGRDFVGIELNKEYVEIIVERVTSVPKPPANDALLSVEIPRRAS